MDEPDALESLVECSSDPFLSIAILDVDLAPGLVALLNERIFRQILKEVPEGFARGIHSSDIHNEGIASNLMPYAGQLALGDEIGIGEHMDMHVPATTSVGCLDRIEPTSNDPLEAFEEGFHALPEMGDTVTRQVRVVD